MKLQSKERLGSTVKKTYDTARTPYQRVLESNQVSQESKDRLQAQYRTLNPVALLRHIEQQQASLWKLAVSVRGKETPQDAVQAVGSLS
jgi:predicted component of type VI protein secretion system